MTTIKLLFEVFSVILAMQIAASGVHSTQSSEAKGTCFVYVGPYTGEKSKGIYVCRFDTNSGRLGSPELAAEVTNPSFLALHPNGRYLYAVSEVSRYEGKKSGYISAFEIDRAKGKLTLLNKASSRGSGPCHLVVDKRGKNVLVANYGSGSVAVLPIKEDGRLGEAFAFVQHTGSSVDPQRQKGPHAHCVTLSPDNRFAFVADLGLDKVMIYRFDPQMSTLTPNDPAFVKVNPGAGPRHFTFHPGGKFGYVINEMQSTVTALSYDGDRGILKDLQSVSTLPQGFSGENTTAEIQVARSGKFLYGSNRGNDTIAIYAIDPGKGTLTPLGHVPTQGKEPRSFNIDPSGSFLLAANQNSNSVVVFRIDRKSGGLKPTGQSVEVFSPVCIEFLKLE